MGEANTRVALEVRRLLWRYRVICAALTRYGLNLRALVNSTAEPQDSMAFLEEYGEFAVHDLTWEKFVSEDEYGQPTYGVPQPLKARTDMQGFLYNTSRGVEVEGRGASYFAPVGATGRDRFTIHTGEVVQNLRVWTIDDENGVPHTTELLFG